MEMWLAMLYEVQRASLQMRVLSRDCHWSMDASMVRCSMLCQTSNFITESNMSNATNKILQ